MKEVDKTRASWTQGEEEDGTDENPKMLRREREKKRRDEAMQNELKQDMRLTGMKRQAACVWG